MYVSGTPGCSASNHAHASAPTCATLTNWQRRSLLIETSVDNYVLLMFGALSKATDFALAPGGATTMKLRYMPEGTTKLSGTFALPLVSDGIPSEVSELIFSLPTSDAVAGTNAMGRVAVWAVCLQC